MIHRVRASAGTASTHAVLMLIAAFMVFPVLWAVSTSLTPRAGMFDSGLLPSTVTLQHYRDALEALPLWRLLVNTTVIAGAVAAGQVLLSVLAAYGITRYRFKGRRFVFAALVGAILVPQQTLIIPNYLLVAELGWLNTYLGLVVPQLATTTVGIFLLRQHMAAFPTTLLDAAQMDGATDAELLWRVLVPSLRPVLAALGIIVFIQTWNEYLWPLLITRGDSVTTVQIGLSIFRSELGNQWGALMAASTMASAPLLMIYVLAQRRIIDAFIRGGLR